MSQCRRATSLLVLWLVGVLLPAATAQEPPFFDPVRLESDGAPADEAIETDRDSFTPATTTAGSGRFILESAHSFLDNRGVKETHSLPELLVRYGVGERLELRLGWNYEVGGAANEITGADVGESEVSQGGDLERESRIAYGLKYRVTDQDLWVPASAVIVQGFTPTSGEASDTQLVATGVLGWAFAERWRLDGAVRYSTGSENEDRFDVLAPSVVLKAEVVERVNVHAEYFGIFSTGKATDFTHHFFSPGVHFLVTPDLEVGLRVGWGLNDQSARFFTNVGLGCRF